MNDYRNVSFWFDTLAAAITERPALDGDKTVDVAIVGGGYTGLWTAYYLKTLAPSLSIAIIEAETVGFGASGRNGGWLKGGLTGEDKYLSGQPQSIRETGYRLLHGIIDHVAGILRQENIDCGFHKGGVLFAAARYPEQLVLQRQHLDQLRRAGHTDEDYRWLDANELTQHVRMRDAYGAIFSPHCAVIDPGRLVRGLGEAVERKGVAIYERTPAQALRPGMVVTARGTVRAKAVVSALEGYTGRMPGQDRYLLPVQSLIIATEPLTPTQWDALGLADRPAFSDGGRLITYGQRSADDRLIFGARGAYQFGAKPRDRFSLQDPEFRLRQGVMVDLFPSLQGVRVTHGWVGSMGMSRRLMPHVLYDSRAGFALSGGYGGGGVGASNLFSRTLADLILQRDTELTQMPWVIRDVSLKRALRRWEPEPIPWLAYKTILATYSWEESLCRAPDAPAWRKKLAGHLSDTLSLLLA
jgi:glycine/D-amino acid oxidase-like deaminating enzyme